MKKRSKASSRTGEKTSEQEVLLAKLSSCKGGCSLLEVKCRREGLVCKDFFRVGRTGSKKAPTAPAEKDASGYISTHVVNMVDTSASEKEASPLKRRRKRTNKSPRREASPEPLTVAHVPAIEGLASSFIFSTLLMPE
jgi:hypothetical protein